MDVRWLWILGFVCCGLVNVCAAFCQVPDGSSYEVVPAPRKQPGEAFLSVGLVPLTRTESHAAAWRRYPREAEGTSLLTEEPTDGVGEATEESELHWRRRRYVTGIEEAGDEVPSVGAAAPQYSNPLDGARGEAGRYKTTAASLPAPAPTTANVTEVAAGTNGTSSPAAPGPMMDVHLPTTSNGSTTVPAPVPTAAANMTSGAVDAGASAAPAAPSQQPPSAEPTIVQPVQTSQATDTDVVAPSANVSATVTETEGEIYPDRYPQIFTNETLEKHNITKSDEDNHLYYNSTMVTDEALAHSLWMETAGRKDVHTSALLSQSHRRATTVRLSFDFPFYGHPVQNVTVATGGFVYMGDFIHSWLAATQYVAPLMANFDTRISNASYVKYLDNGTAFTVQWDNVHLQDRTDVGGFSFQVTLHRSGDMVFVYRHVPLPVEDIVDSDHPVKVGISDAYIIDRNFYFVRRKTIYEYHRVTFSQQDIQNGTIIKLNALPTCMSAQDCVSCLTQISNFQCHWCKGRCSDGMDRRRQDWLQLSCDKQGLSAASDCLPPAARSQQVQTARQPSGEGRQPAAGDGGAAEDAARSERQRGVAEKHVTDPSGGSSVSVSGVVAILSVVTLACATGVWILYAYRNPHTASGQFLIRYRPSQWSWRRGEARYTAATIHM